MAITAPNSARGGSRSSRAETYARAGRMVLDSTPSASSRAAAPHSGRCAALDNTQPASSRAAVPASNTGRCGPNWTPGPAEGGGSLRRAGGCGAADYGKPVTSRWAKHDTQNKGSVVPNHTKENSDSETEEDFRAMRRKAKEAVAQTPAAHLKASRKIVVPDLIKTLGVQVDASCFDYEGNAERWMSLNPTQKPKEQKAPTDPAEAAVAELIQFFKDSNLSGPLRQYAHAMALQGLKDPAALIEADSARLTKVFRLAELECSDELLLLDALRNFQ